MYINRELVITISKGLSVAVFCWELVFGRVFGYVFVYMIGWQGLSFVHLEIHLKKSGRMVRPEWVFIYYTGETLCVHRPQSIFDSVRVEYGQDAKFIFNNELFSKYSYFWRFDDFAGVVVPLNICEIYAAHTNTETQDVFPILMQIIYPEYVKTPRKFDDYLYDYVERHCVRIPIDEAAKEAAKTVRSPRIFVPAKYMTTQGRDLDTGNITITEIILEVCSVTFWSGPVEFKDIAINVAQICLEQLEFEIPDETCITLPDQVNEQICPENEPQVSEGSMDVEIVTTNDAISGSSARTSRDLYINAGVHINFDQTDITALDPEPKGGVDLFLTDNVIHTLLGLISPLRRYDEKHDDLYVMNSFFMKQLMVNTNPVQVEASAKANFADRLGQWALRPDNSYILAHKNFILIPYNYTNAHWLLYVVYKPYDRTCRYPLLYIFDSSPSSVPTRVHRMNVKGLCVYFNEAFKMHCKDSEYMPVSESRGCKFADVPRQTNGWACGWYTFLFARELIRSREARERIIAAVQRDEPVLESMTEQAFSAYRVAICKRILTDISKKE